MSVSLASPRPVVDLAFVIGLTLVGLAMVWEMVQHPWLFVVVGVTLTAATSLAWLAVSRRWRRWVRVVTVLITYLVLGGALAAPSLYRDVTQAPSLLLKVATAPVTGWKDLLTLDLPLGTYQATLAPTLLLFLVLPYIALQLAWQSPRWWGFASPVTLLMTVYGIAFGSSALRNMFITSTQVIIALAAFLIALAWLVWRAMAERSRALRRADETVYGRRRRRFSGARLALGVTIMTVASLAGIVAAPTLTSGQSREVLRTNVAPEVIVQQRITPLTTYREFFTDERYDEVLLRVDAPPEVTRLTLIRLEHFDGSQMRISSDTSTAKERSFSRVPSAVGGGELHAVDVTIEAYDDVWVPLAGELRSIDFGGSHRSALADGFFYRDSSMTGVQLATTGFQRGDTIRERIAVVVRSSDVVTDFTPARVGSSLDEAITSAALETWVTEQAVSHDGAGLLELIDRLRARGVLSHALNIDPASPPRWLGDVGASFVVSRAGHSTDRIDRLFTEMLDRETAVGESASPAELVAASGDDEQFAVAAALIADYLGFEARVAVGFRLQDSPELGAVDPCEAGECRGAHLSAWVEVQDAVTGQWAEIVTTPQHEIAPSSDLKQHSDPKNPSDTEEQSATVVQPPEANPSEASERNDEDETVFELPHWLVPALRIVGVGLLALLVLISPFVLIIGAKALRRKTRRNLTYPSDNIAAAWEEYVDTSIDHGFPEPGLNTRSEIAQLYAGEGSRASWLATVADHADYSAEGATIDAVEPYWQALATERARMRAAMNRRERVFAAISLRSIRYWFVRVKRRADSLGES